MMTITVASGPVVIDATAAPYSAPDDGVTDATAAIQAAIDAAAARSGGTVIARRRTVGTYIADGIVLKDNVQLVSPDWAVLKAKAGGTSPGVIVLAAGPVQRASVDGFQIVGNGNAGQHGIHFKAVADGGGTGGLWYSALRNLLISGFAGCGIWLRGGGTSGLLPMQFLDIEDVHTYASATGKGVQLSGQVGQVNVLGGITEGPSVSNAGMDFRLIRELNDAETVISDRSPYAIRFLNHSFQTNKQGLVIDRAHVVTAETCYWESTGQAVTAINSAELVKLSDPQFSNAGYVGDGTGYLVDAGAGCSVVLVDPYVTGSVETYWRGSSATGYIEQRGGRGSASGPGTSGITKQVAQSAGALALGAGKTFLVNATATNITTLTSEKGCGEELYLKAWGGTFPLATGGNISLGGRTSPVVVPANAIARMVKFDLGTGWDLVSVSA